MKPKINAAYASQSSLEESDKVARVKQINHRHIKEELNDYERSVITSLNDWHAPQLRNALAYTDKVNRNACVNEYGTTFLHYAASKQDSRSDTGHGPIEILMLAGCSIFAQDDSGLLPYDYAMLKNNKVNALIIQKEYDFLSRKQENKKELLSKIKKGDYTIATPESKAEVEKMGEILQLIRQSSSIYQKQKNNVPLTESEEAVAAQIAQYRPVITEEEVLNLEAQIKEFEENSVIYKERLEAYKEPKLSSPKI